MLRDNYSLVFKKRAKPPKNSLESWNEDMKVGEDERNIKFDSKAKRAKLDQDDDSDVEIPIKKPYDIQRESNTKPQI